MRTMTGSVAVAQEGRFRLELADGRSALFVLAHDAPLEAQDLLYLARDCAAVTVHYEEASPMDAKLARDVTEPGPQPQHRVGGRPA